LLPERYRFGDNFQSLDLLALCPNHSTMYQHTNGSSDEVRETFAQLETNELDVILAQGHATIYFTKTHIADLKTVIGIDEHSSVEAPTSATMG
jgi:catalase (peroxidase I)